MFIFVKKLYFLRKLIYILFIFPVLVFSQPKDIDYKSDRTNLDEEKYPGAFIFNKVTNQVYFKHEGIEVWCDQAIFYQKENFFKAFGNVKMQQGDTIKVRSKYAEYDGNSKFAFASDNVSLKTPENRLQTDSLFFDRQKQEAFYRSGGQVRDSLSTITSQRGTYFMEKEKYSFREDVVVTHPQYVIHSDHIDFYTKSAHAYLYGPSTIEGDESTVYCERGFYDTRADEGYFIKNSNVKYEQRDLYGDSIYFNRENSYAAATNDVKVIDTINASTLYGQFAEVFRAKDSLIVTGLPHVATLQEGDKKQDSLFIASDTIVLKGKDINRDISAFYDVRIYKSDMSGKSDSLHVDEKTGLTKMIGNPVLWSFDNQITGDTIELISNKETEKLDSLKVFDNSFMIQRDSIDGYNQVKGKYLYGLFEDSELYEVNVIKNTETIYFIREDDGQLFGINKSLAARIKMLLEDREVTDIYYYNQPEDKTYPEEDFSENARKLKGFLWRGDEELTKKSDLFTDRKTFKKKLIKGIEDPEEEEERPSKFEINEKSTLNSRPEKKDIKIKESDSE